MSFPIPPARRSIPSWQAEPYRVLFPLGLLLAWAGVLHWLLLATGAISAYLSIFHSLTQVEGVLTSFAVGFLFTMIPRKTGTAPAARWQIATAALAPTAITICAWFEKWAVSQIAWLFLMGVCIEFAVRRFARRAPGTDIPDSFVWVVLAFAIAAAGSILTAVGAAARREELFWLHDVGRALVLQGMFSALVLGVGGMLFPLITRASAPLQGTVRGKLAHAVAGLVFFSSFWVEALWDQRLGFALRAAVALAVLLWSGRIYRLPTAPGLHRKMVWVAAWMMPLGFAFVAAFPELRRAGLHIVFIGSFALMALSVSVHVALAHGGAPEKLSRGSWPVWALGGLLAVALLLRLLVDLDPAHVYRWLGGAAAAFLIATACWAMAVAPRLLRR
jgi:uncharacterized protein involved in response to NO